ncbi:hypothetical protein P0Y35_03105 [Kiritimatiellaeota bacterium B1221]|nr:hypothetical protein [Kiritimatiellaeota bacterium B1221]
MGSALSGRSRIPLISRYPKRFPAGKQCSLPARLVDIAPTFCRAAGRDEDPSYHGVDLSELANGTSERETVFCQYNPGENTLTGSVNTEYKYVWSAPDPKEDLFAREDAPGTRNLADSSKTIVAKKALKAQWMAHHQAGNFAEEILKSEKRFLKVPIRKMPKDPDEGLIFQDPSGFKLQLPEQYLDE